MLELEWTEVEIPDGPRLRLLACPSGLRAIEFAPFRPARGNANGANPLLREAARQLRSYFAGKLWEFCLPLDLQGTGFQTRVWAELCAIPYGETRSYAEIAAAIGRPTAVRAVGAANGANPLPVVVPCHRVIGSRGSLVGYGGGLELKKRLLELENASRR